MICKQIEIASSTTVGASHALSSCQSDVQEMAQELKWEDFNMAEGAEMTGGRTKSRHGKKKMEPVDWRKILISWSAVFLAAFLAATGYYFNDKFDDIDKQFNRIDSSFEEVNETIAKSSEALNEQIQSIRQETSQQHQWIFKLVDKLHPEVNVVVGFKKNRNRHNNEATFFSELEDIRAKLDAVSARLTPEASKYTILNHVMGVLTPNDLKRIRAYSKDVDELSALNHAVWYVHERLAVNGRKTLEGSEIKDNTTGEGNDETKLRRKQKLSQTKAAEQLLVAEERK